MKYVLLMFIITTNISSLSQGSIALNDVESHFLYTPGRLKQVPIPTQNSTQISECKLCKTLEENNPNEFPLLRTRYFTVMLNLFPYAEGHLLIVANFHNKMLDQLTLEQSIELISLISQSATILKVVFKCPGMNVGYNEGRCAGASVIDHFHMHVLPRFEIFDKSFAPVISNLHVVPWNLKELQQRLKPYFEAIKERFVVQS